MLVSYEAHDITTETKLVEMILPESKMLEKLNTVSTAKRVANIVSDDILTSD